MQTMTENSHGGPRVPGPGKRLGRPPVENPRVLLTTRVNSETKTGLEAEAARRGPKSNPGRVIDELFADLQRRRRRAK